MAAEKQPEKQQQKRRMLLLVCIVLLLCGIGAEGYLLIRRAESSIFTIRRDPAAELLEAVQSGDYTGAKIIRLTDFPEGEVPENVTKRLSEQAQACRDAYFAGQTEAETAKALMQQISDLEIPAVTEAVKPLSEEIRLHEMWLALIRKANASVRAGDYEDAFRQYSRLPKDDASLTELYAEQLEQTVSCLTEEAQEQIIAAEQAHDYDTAASCAEHMRLLLNDQADFWDDELAGIRARQQQYQYTEACRNARIYYDSGEYAAAFDALRSLPDAVRETYPAEDTLQSYQDSYFRILPVTVQNLLDAGETEQAEQLAAEAAALFPDAEEIAALQDQIRSAVPQELIAFGEPVLSDFTQSDTALTGSDGKTYQSETGNLYYSYDGAQSGRKNCTAEFRIGGGYGRLTLTAVPQKDFDRDTTVLLEISDGKKELETYAISRKTGALHIDLDITGAERLLLRIRPSAGAEDLRNAGVIIADAIVKS